MTISADHAFTGPYVANGIATRFAFDFQAASGAEVGVVIGGVEVDPTAFTVVLEADRTGEVRFVEAPAVGTGDLYVFSKPDFLQKADFQRFGPILPDKLNPELDFGVIRDIALKDEIGRSLRVGVGDTLGLLPGDRNGGLLGFDALTGQPVIVNGDNVLDLIGTRVTDFASNGDGDSIDFGENADSDAVVIDYGD